MDPLVVKHPEWGILTLPRENGAPDRDLVVAYVDTGSDELDRATWVDGSWVAGRKTLSKPVLGYYEIRRLDGTPTI